MKPHHRIHRPGAVSAFAAAFEHLEARRLMAVHFAIDAGQNVHPISRYIYGVNQSITGQTAKFNINKTIGGTSLGFQANGNLTPQA